MPHFFLDGSIIFHTMFGLSTNFWMALLSRFLLGSCNGMLGSVKVRTISIENMVDVFMHLGEFFTFRGLALVLTDQRFVE